MANTTYATVADLTAWLSPQTPPDAATAQRLLNRAALLIDSELVGVTYGVDANGNPTDANLVGTIQAFNDATCAQVEYWLANSDELGNGQYLQGYSIEGMQVQYKEPPPRFAPRARDVFRVLGLLPSPTPIHMP